MKKSIPVLGVLLLICGCSTSGMSKLVRELKGDPATVSATVTSIYGNVKLVRIGGQTNNAVSVGPDGTVTITPKP